MTENLSCGAQLKCNGHRNYKDEKEIDVPINTVYILHSIPRKIGKDKRKTTYNNISKTVERYCGTVYRASHSIIFLI